jgi:hypothetical protein
VGAIQLSDKRPEVAGSTIVELHRVKQLVHFYILLWVQPSSNIPLPLVEEAYMAEVEGNLPL